MAIIIRYTVFIIAALFGTGYSWAETASTCYGTTSNGRLENGFRLPSSGSNFRTYSHIGRILGRTYVHSLVGATVVETYAAVEKNLPETVFVYGETGKKKGGAFDPHKTHQNGLSVDFMVPVLDQDGKSVPLPTNALNKWGYDIEFNSDGAFDDLQIDFDAIAEHIYQLHLAAKKNGGDLWRVILAPELQPHLRATKRWSYLNANITFSTKRSWVRHDEHYHVDFEFGCEPAA